LWLLAAEVLVKLGQGVGHAAFKANGDYPLIATMYSITLLLQYVGMWCIAALGLGPIYAAAAFLIARIATGLVEAIMLVHRHSWLRFGVEYARFAVLQQLLGPALANVATPFALTLSNQGMILVIGATLGVTAVVTFSVLRTLTRILVQAVLGIANAIEADFAAAYGASKIELLRTLYLNSLRGGIWLTIGGAIVLLSYGDLLLTYWTSGNVNMDLALFNWLLLTAIASVLWQNGLTLLRAANRHLRAALFSVVTASFGVTLSWLLLYVTHNLAYAGACVFVMDLIFAAFAVRAAAAFCGVRPISSVLQALDPLPLIRLLYTPRHGR
jgi:O-antigen/teichoic acid export membrane protein